MEIKVLMYGWEFPPQISGGLGVACYAIVKELSKKNIDLTLILPQTSPGFSIDHVNLIGCDNLIVADDAPEFDGAVTIKYPEIATYLSPYVTDKDFKRFFCNETLRDFLTVLASMHLPSELKEMAIATAQAQMSGAKITGKYGISLLMEVFRYALIAGALAKNVEHNVIHAHDWLTALAAVEAKKISKKPFIFHIHALETDRSGLWVPRGR